MLRVALLVLAAVAALTSSLVFAQEKKPERFQDVLWHVEVDMPSKRKPNPQRDMEIYVAKLKLLRSAAKAAKVTNKLHPDQWGFGTLRAGKKTEFVKFRDEQQKARAIAEIDESLEKLEADLDLFKKGKLLTLPGIDLKCELGRLRQARLLSTAGEKSHLWDVKGVPIVIENFAPDVDAMPIPRPDGEEGGNWFQLDAILKRNGEREVDIDGETKAVPKFTYLNPDQVKAEEERLGKKFFSFTLAKYGLEPSK